MAMNSSLKLNTACVFMSSANGGTFGDELSFVKEHHPDWSASDMGAFIGAANKVYCKDEQLVPGGFHSDDTAGPIASNHTGW
jgi:hypothetical protein